MTRKKIGFGLVFLVIVGLMVLGIRHKRGLVKIESTIAHHPKLEIEMLGRKVEEEGQYHPLLEDAIISGQVELIAEIPKGEEEIAYLEYKINGFNYKPGYSPSYRVIIDTKELPHGRNQILAIGYGEEGSIVGVNQVIFKVDNKAEKSRPPRQVKTYKIGQDPSYKRAYIPVLMYHDFRENISQEQESAIVHPKLFEDHLKALLEHDYNPINFYDLYLYMEGKGGLPSKPVIITADDGYLSNYEIAFPILKKYKIPATFFVTSRYVGVETSSSHFTWDQGREMEESGLIDIQSHTHSHLLLNTLPDHEMRHQVDVSFGIIEQNLGKRDVKVLAYPQFYHNKHTQEILAQEGVDLQVTKLAKKYKPVTNQANIQRIHVANDTRPEDLIKAIKKLTR